MPNHQATQFAAAFDRLGRQMLAQLESLPEETWHRPPPIPHRDSLFTLASRFLEESEYWVLIVIGGRDMAGEHSSQATSPSTRATLLQRHERWLTEMHRLLDHLPDAIMNLFVEVPSPHREMPVSEPFTVRECLLYALEQSGLLVGQIEYLGQILAASERNLHEVIVKREIYKWTEDQLASPLQSN
jgi:hypothetical protein